MWLEIDESLVNFHPTLNLSECAALETIILSVFYGENALFAKKRTLEWLLKQEFSKAAKSVCLKIKNKLPEYSSLRRIIEARVIIVSSNNTLEVDEDGFWRLPLNMLEKNPRVVCTLLAENLSDAEVYLIAAKHYQEHKGIKGLVAKLTSSGGGGNQIYPEFKRFVKEKDGFCLSITDTDRDYPQAESNDTSKNCKILADKQEWIAAHMDVPARELENILPINIVEDAIFEDQGAVDLQKRFEKIKERVSKNQEALLYCDLKMGTKFSWSSNFHGNREKEMFWKCFLKSNNPPLATCGNCGSQCKLFMIDSLGEKIAEKFLDYCNKKSTKKQYERVKTSANAEQWLEVGRKVFHWGAATPRART